MASPRRILLHLLLASTSMLALPACHTGIDCLADIGRDDPECLRRVEVRFVGDRTVAGLPLEVTLQSTNSGRSDRVRTTIATNGIFYHDFGDFAHEASGPYELIAFIDVDRDGTCDGEPTDSVRREAVPSSGSTLVEITLAGSPPSACP